MNPLDFDGGSVCEYKGSSCGQCWALTGPGGTANIQVTDCCAGYPGNPSCLTSTDALCDWCASNDNQHFDLDWNSYASVCAGQTDAGHCLLTSAVQIACPSSAVADDLAVADLAVADATSTPADAASTASPAWAIALIVLGSVVLILLLIVVVLLFMRLKKEEHV